MFCTESALRERNRGVFEKETEVYSRKKQRCIQERNRSVFKKETEMRVSQNPSQLYRSPVKIVTVANDPVLVIRSPRHFRAASISDRPYARFAYIDLTRDDLPGGVVHYVRNRGRPVEVIQIDDDSDSDVMIIEPEDQILDENRGDLTINQKADVSDISSTTPYINHDNLHRSRRRRKKTLPIQTTPVSVNSLDDDEIVIIEEDSNTSIQIDQPRPRSKRNSRNEKSAQTDEVTIDLEVVHGVLDRKPRIPLGLGHTPFDYAKNKKKVEEEAKTIKIVKENELESITSRLTDLGIGSAHQVAIPKKMSKEEYLKSLDPPKDEVMWKPSALDKDDITLYWRAVFRQFDGHIPMEFALKNLMDNNYSIPDALETIDTVLKELPQQFKPLSNAQYKVFVGMMTSKKFNREEIHGKATYRELTGRLRPARDTVFSDEEKKRVEAWVGMEAEKGQRVSRKTFERLHEEMNRLELSDEEKMQLNLEKLPFGEDHFSRRDEIEDKATLAKQYAKQLKPYPLPLFVECRCEKEEPEVLPPMLTTVTREMGEKLKKMTPEIVKWSMELMDKMNVPMVTMEFGVYQAIHTFLSAFGVGINIFLLFLAVTKSPKIMRPCSALITNKSLTDIMSSLANFFVMQRIITDGKSVTIIPTGPCTSFGSTACYAGHMFMGSFLEHNLIWLIACYLFRYYILYVRDPSIKSIIFAAFMVYTPSFIHMAIWIKLFDAEQANSTSMVLTGSTVYWSSLVVYVQLVVTAILVVIAYTWIRNVLINFILSMGATLSKDVKLINKQLVKILTFQVCIPIWIFLGVFFFLAMYTQNAQPDILQYSITISFMLAPVISPFAYIFFVPHYWNFCIGKKYVTPMATSICASSTASMEKKSVAS
uniref:ELM2 domain-containing protein n=1 Tax=Caenorhabditis tropicalis TaxID=1561998 RepID=A0A1I7U4L6_9PELO